MGGVEVLQPQDLLNNHRRHHHHRSNRHNSFSTSAMKSQSFRNANSGSAVARSADRGKRSPPKITPALPKVKKSTRVPLTEKNSEQKNTAKSTSDLVMGQVKILKRGEVLPTALSSVKVDVFPMDGSALSSAKADIAPNMVKKVDFSTRNVKKDKKEKIEKVGGLDDLVLLSSADRLGPEPDAVTNNIRISGFYAGLPFATSPEPSSLPLPVFFKKKDVLVDDDCSNTNYDATSDLRRLLRLDLS